jgi:hypothetical protein
MRKIRFIAPLMALLLTVGLMLAGCSNVFLEKPEEAKAPSGFGTVRVDLSVGAARTVVPSAVVFNHYEYWFAKGGAEAAKKDAVDGLFSLEPGSYTLTVKAFATEEDESLAATGTSDTFTVAAQQNTAVSVNLRPFESGGEGTFQFSFRYPSEGTSVIDFSLTRLADDTAINPGGVNANNNAGIFTEAAQ